MPLPTIPSGNVASALGGAYEVANSCRFDGSSAVMEKTFSSAGNRDTFTLSCWVKRSGLSTTQRVIGWKNNGGGYGLIWEDTDQLKFLITATGSNAAFTTNRVFRDTSAWYSIILKVDTTQSTEADRMRLYINGVEETSFASRTYPNQNEDTHINLDNKCRIGCSPVADNSYFSGYLAEVCFIDGSALAPTEFGEFDEDSPTIWKPKDVSGLTFGSNGFYLDFEDSGDLDDDESGNGNDFTASNLAAVDQSTDTPTNNFCTLNPLSADEMTFAEGNCKVTQASDDGGGSRTDDNARGTMGVSSGKWYWEVKSTGGTTPVVVGICFDELKMGSDLSGLTGVYAIQNASATNAYKRENGTTAETSGFTNPAVNDIINVALDMDNGKLYIGINGTYENQAGSTGNPASGSNETFSSISANYFWLPFVESRGDNQTAECNFGGCPAFSISSGNSDGNGYGNFEYAVPSGFYALCSKNLAEYG